MARVNQRNDLLTGLRWLAAILVVLHHIAWIPAVFKEASIFYQLHRSGHSGVTLFFILSGLVLAMGYHDRVRTGRQVLSFYWARVARIVPLWLLISLPVIAEGSVPLEYLLMVQAWSGDTGITFSGVAVAWTLSVEFFFYALFPIIIVLANFLHRTKRASMVLILSGIAIPAGGVLFFALTPYGMLQGDDPMSPHRWLYRMPIMRLGDFILGVGLYYLWREVPRLSRYWLAFTLTGLFSFAAVIWKVDQEFWSYDAAFILPFSMLILGLLSAPDRIKRWTPKEIVILGNASFALYLIHQSYVIPYYQNLMGDPAIRPFESLTVIVVIASAASVGFYMLIERPAQQFLRGAWIWTIRRAV